MKIIKANFLQIALIICLMVYQIFAFTYGRLPNLTGLWDANEVTLKMGSKKISLNLYHIEQSPEGLSFIDENQKFNVLYLGFPLHYVDYVLDLPPHILVLGDKSPVHWYYFKGEATYAGDSPTPAFNQDNISNMLEVASKFRALGATVIELPIPAKSLIEPEHAPENLRQSSDPSGLYRQIVEADPDWTVDVYSALSAAHAKNPEEPIFRALDHHWTSWGANVAVKEIVRFLKAKGFPADLPQIQLVRRGEMYKDDITRCSLNQLLLPRWYAKNKEELQWSENFYQTTPAKTVGTGRLIVFGTSFSTQLQHLSLDLPTMLGHSLGIPVVDFSAAGETIFQNFVRARRANLKINKDDIVILEFPMAHLRALEKSMSQPATDALLSKAGT